METIVLYHAHCNDGKGAAFAHWYLVGKDMINREENVCYIPVEYGKPLPFTTHKEQDIIFLDFSLKKEATISLLEQVNSVTIIDHHENAMQEVLPLEKEYPNLIVVFDIKHSGAVLTWKYYASPNEEVPYFLLLIDDRDLWKFIHADTKPFTAALMANEILFPDFEMLISRNSLALQELILQGDAILAYKDSLIEKIAESKYVATIGSKIAMFCNCPLELMSDTGDYILKNTSQLQTVVLFHEIAGQVKYSIRTKRNEDSSWNVDASSLARLYGGNGHFHASGFSLPLEDSHLGKGLA